MQNVHILKNGIMALTMNLGQSGLLSQVHARLLVMTSVSNPFLLNYYLYAFGFQTYPWQVFLLYACQMKFLAHSLSSQVEATEMEPLCPSARVCQAGNHEHH